jgi:hypothetical protein
MKWDKRGPETDRVKKSKFLQLEEHMTWKLKSQSMLGRRKNN